MCDLVLDSEEREALQQEQAARKRGERNCSCGTGEPGGCLTHGDFEGDSLLEQSRALRRLYDEARLLRVKP